MNCGHDGCGACCGGTCGGCAGELTLTQAEIDLLDLLAQSPFLPVARRADSETPVCLEAGAATAETWAAAILGLHQKGLIELDYDIPLSNFDYQTYANYPCQGSMALTARGQTVVELLDVRGVSD